ncbi:methyltransferase domain-containing protein [Halosimplex aquaticum]|uniref:Methyltransferase domain-containing protein n=1 Tax=Halosimplex aquaticum TaxID=3026162 RepID=A0ABD5Y4G1_9EURY|nr:methyltransferase domain-containing protein [Halosimplex aquaticum]
MSGSEETEMLERISAVSSAEALREFVRNALGLSSGESVLSVGCGPGYEPAEIAGAVGEGGRVLGVDVNGAILTRARERCAGRPQVSFERGDVTDLPIRDGSFDVALAKQVLQFVGDVDAALAEIHRVLEPGGRIAVVAGDSDAHVLHSTDRDRARRIEAAYRDVRPDRHLGTRLRSLLPAAGFHVSDVHAVSVLHTAINEQVERGIEVRREILSEQSPVDQSTIDAWESDLRALDDAGEFLSCGTQFVYLARKPREDG